MSAQSSRAGRRPAISTLLQRMLQTLYGWCGSRIADTAASISSSSVTRRTAIAFETLEPRLLLSADLIGDGAAIFLADQTSSDGSAFESPFAYSLIAVDSSIGNGSETGIAGNSTTANSLPGVAWTFGNVAGSSHSASITLADAAGTKVNFKLTGPGQGSVELVDGAFDVHLTGTTSDSTLKISTTGGLGYATINKLQVDGSLNAAQASNLNLAGKFELSGTVRSVELRDIGQNAEVSILGPGVPIKFSAAHIAGAEIHSASSFESISIKDWTYAGTDSGAIHAPSIGKLVVKGEFAGDLNLPGAASGLTLGNAEIGGRISGELWNVAGSVGMISAQSIGALWHGSFVVSLDKLITSGDMAGQLASVSIGTIDVGGNLTGARILVGVNLGSDGRPGGSGNAADQYFEGTLGKLRVHQSILDSTIFVGVNPVDAIYQNGNDVIVGGQASRIQSLTVDGALLGATSIIAGAFPDKVKINGDKQDPANVQQLHTAVPDTVAPQISVSLTSDTGASASDRVTRDPGVSGVVVEAGSLATFRVALDNTSASGFVDIKSRLQSGGSFVLDAAALASIFGAPVSDGMHTLHFQATDGAGNLATAAFAFTLDTSAPSTLYFELDPSSDTGVPGDQLTSIGLVTLRGTTESGVAVQLEDTGFATVSDGSGNFSFGNVALIEGVNAFTVRATDLAGNQTQFSQSISRDSTAPALNAVLLNDSGFSNSDQLTNDATISGHLSDASGVVSLIVGIDNGPGTEIVPSPVPGFDFVLGADFLDSLAGGVLADGPHTVNLQARDAAGNISISEVYFVLDRHAPENPDFGLAPESDTGTPGDQRTTESIVSLTGFSEANIALTIAGTSLSALSDASGVFRFDGIALALGENVFTVRAVDGAGNESLFTRSIFRDEVVAPGGFPDLVVTSIDRYIIEIDEYGQTLLQVDWITANLGSAVAHGLMGEWAETVYLSMSDALPFSGDDVFLGFNIVTQDLGAGEQRMNSLLVSVPDWVGLDYRIYIVVDDDLGFISNQVFEKAAGEYNNITLEDVPSGIAPPDIAESGPVLPLSDSPIGGSISAPGEVDVFTFELTEQTRLYFDSLSADPDMVWTLKNSAGDTLLSRSFSGADAFGLGNANPLIGLAGGSYTLAVSNAAGQTGNYAFRLMDVDAVASHELVLDGGALLGRYLERGDLTQVYQFEATAGTQYVVGGPGDSTIEGALFWRLFDPNGNQIWTGQASPSDIGTFAQTGTYTLLVEGRVGRTDPTNYNVYVFTPQDRYFGLTTGEHVQGFLDAPGQVNTYSFELTESSALFFDGQLSSNGPHFEWTLLDATTVLAAGNTRVDSGADGSGAPLIQLDAGNYTLRVQGQGDASGWYNFRLIDVLHDAAQTLTLDEPTFGFLAPGFTSALYRFDGLEGQTISVALTTYDPDWLFDPASWLLIDPQGNALVGGVSGTSGSIELNDSGTWSVLVIGRQFNWPEVAFALTVGSSAAPDAPVFDLAPESDTGPVGDHHTTQAIVSLAGIAAPDSMLTLQGTSLTTLSDASGVFRFDGIALALGENVFTVRAVDGAGNESLFTRSIFRDEVVAPGGFPDLVVTSIDRYIIEIDEYGQTLLQVDWITANLGSAVAHGLMGEWAETVYLSMSDALPFSGDDVFLGFNIVTQDLGAGEQRMNSLLVSVPDWVGLDYRIYIVVDDDLGFISNQVFEKAAGEYNNITLEDVPSGIAPPDIAESGPVLPLSDSPIGGSISAPGEVDVFTFELTEQTRLYFDSLSADPDMVWTLKNSAGDTLLSRSFSGADAFGLGNANPLIGLAGGSYTLAVSNAAGQTGNYAFRLMDVDAVASHELVLDGGALLGRYLERGDLTQVYQFEATAGTQYVVGGPGDSTIEGALFWRLFDPNGNQIWTGQASPSDIGTFAQTGTYTLLVEGRVGRTDPTNYNVYVFTPQDRYFGLTTGEHVQGFLDAPGQVNTYSFELTESSALFFDGQLSSNGPHFEWTLLDATTVLAAGNTRVDSGADGSGAPLIQLDAGNYTLRVQGQGDASGWYNFRLIDVLHDAAQTLTLDEPTFGFLAPGFTSALYRFDGLEGQTISVALTTYDPDWLFDPASWLLIDPFGNFVLFGEAGMPMEATLNSGGNWSLLVLGRQGSWDFVDFELTIGETVMV